MAAKQQGAGILDQNGKPIKREIASVKLDPIYGGFLNYIPERDEITLTKGGGQGVDIYDRLKKEPVVADKLPLRVLGVIAKKWEVTLPENATAAIDKEFADWLSGLLETIDYDELCKRALTNALLKGRDIHEIMWGEQKNMTVPVNFKPRRAGRFGFDDEGRLRLRTTTNYLPGELMPDNKFIVHVIDATDENPYGDGLGAVIWWWAYFKRRGIGFWLTLCDKLGIPTAVGKYEDNADDALQKKLLEALSAMASDSGIIIPKSMEIDLLEMTKTNIDTHEKLCRYCDEMISRTIIHQADSSRDAGGALMAAQESKAEVRADVLQADSDLLTATHTRDLVRPLRDYNFPGAELPRIWRNHEPEKNLKERVEVDGKLHEIGYRPRSVEYINTTYGGDWVLAPKPDPLAGPTIGDLARAGKNAPSPLGEGGGEGKHARAGSGSAADTAANEAAFAEAAPAPLIDTYIANALKNSRAARRAMIAPIEKLVQQSKSFDEVKTGLIAMFSELPVEDFAVVVEEAIKAADAAGRYEVQQSLKGDPSP